MNLGRYTAGEFKRACLVIGIPVLLNGYADALPRAQQKKTAEAVKKWKVMDLTHNQFTFSEIAELYLEVYPYFPILSSVARISPNSSIII